MTSWHNMIATIVAFCLFVVASLVIIGAVVWGIRGYNYVASLYTAAGADGKLSLVGGVIIGTFIGTTLAIAAGALGKRMKNK